MWKKLIVILTGKDGKQEYDPALDILEKMRERGYCAKAIDWLEDGYRSGYIMEKDIFSAEYTMDRITDIGEALEFYSVKESPGRKAPGTGKWDPVYGAVYGDIIGSRYEGSRQEMRENIDRVMKDPAGELCFPTDDTMLTIATAKAVLSGKKYVIDDSPYSLEIIRAEKPWPFSVNPYADTYYKAGTEKPALGYGSMFLQWLSEGGSAAYGSLGNGSAMRVSPVGCFFGDQKDVIVNAVCSAVCTHDHVEGVRGAVVTAMTIWMARNGYTKKQILQYMKRCYAKYTVPLFEKYTFSEAAGIKTHQVETAYSVPAAVICFAESTSFGDAVGKAACVGFDTDTNACIAGGIAAAYYGIDSNIVKTVENLVLDRLGIDLRKVLGNA